MSTLIQGIRVYITAPDGQNLVVVRVDTNQPGLYGLGCATLAYRAYAVKQIIEDCLAPLLIGRDVSRIEDLWRLMTFNSYWRNGPLINNAASGIDMALWDIKAKMANMPLYDLLGGKCRERVNVYRHCNGTNKEKVFELAEKTLETGCRYLRVAYTGYDAPSDIDSGYLCLANGIKTYDPKSHTKHIIDLLSFLRAHYGDRVELMTDTHERLDPTEAVLLAKALESLNLYFMEDPVAPEHIAWLERIRSSCTTPIGMGELFTSPHEYRQVIEKRWVDFIRCHLSAIGGLTPARKVAALAELYGVRTAWHGSLDMTPIAMAVQTHLDFASPNFGIQEYYGYGPATAGVFPGAPVYQDGALWLNDAPGHGVSFDEKEAAKYPPHEKITQWTEMRPPDGTLHTP